MNREIIACLQAYISAVAIQYSVTPYGGCDCCPWAQMRYGGQSNCFLNDIGQERKAQHAGVEKMQK